MQLKSNIKSAKTNPDITLFSFKLSSLTSKLKRTTTVAIAVFDGMGSVIRRGRSRHNMSALICGLDVHKDSTYATLLNSEGKVAAYLSRFKFGKVAMESSTAVAPLYRQLKKEGFDAVVSLPSLYQILALTEISLAYYLRKMKLFSVIFLPIEFRNKS